MNPWTLLFSTFLFCLIYGAAYGAALNRKNDTIIFLNRDSVLIAIAFSLILFILNRPFG
ncbi:hypothetical protein OMCYN_01807 [cyanobiont of Ornithocercus magnificus]|nr:hypothetical protein OMCYN_01807 [cyanobiont of Ornithocercus magnificus]